METTTTNTADLAQLARGLGRSSYRAGRMVQQAVSEALVARPELAAHVDEVRAGWRAERSEAVETARAAL